MCVICNSKKKYSLEGIKVKKTDFDSTAMTDKLNEDQRNRILGNIPLGRMGEGSDIGAAVTYLAADEAGWVTGSTMHVNGGMAML